MRHFRSKIADYFARKEIFTEEIFAEFNIAVLSVNREIQICFFSFTYVLC